MLHDILSRRIKSYIVVLSILVFVFISPQTLSAGEKVFEVDVRTDVKIPMRDGVELSAHIFLPKSDGRFPVILVRCGWLAFAK